VRRRKTGEHGQQGGVCEEMDVDDDDEVCVCCIAQREMDDVCVRERGRRR
jgi:hypothetical protein